MFQEQIADNVFRRSGGAWQVRFKGGKPFTVLPWLGANYIHHLLIAPGQPRPALDIVCSTAVDFCDRAISEHEAVEAGLQSVANPMLENLGNVSDWKAVGQ